MAMGVNAIVETRPPQTLAGNQVKNINIMSKEDHRGRRREGLDEL